MKSKKSLKTSFFSMGIIFTSLFFSLNILNFTNNENEINVDDNSPLTTTQETPSTIPSSTIYEGNNFILNSEYISEDSVELTFVNISTYDPTDLLTFSYEITDVSSSSIVDEEFFNGNGTNFYSKTYLTSNLVPTNEYSFEIEAFYGENPIPLSTTFSATIPEYDENNLIINDIQIKDETAASNNDGSLILNYTLDDNLSNTIDEIIIGVFDSKTHEMVSYSISHVSTKDSKSESFNVLISGLDSGTYDLVIYGMDTTVNGENNYFYLNSVLNIVISTPEGEEENPYLKSSIIDSYATSPTTAKMNIYTTNKSLLGDNTLQYSLNGGEPVNIDNVNEGVTHVELTGLEENTNYNVELSSSDGTVFDSYFFSTSESEIIKAPILNIEKENITTTSATINYSLFSSDLITNLTYSLSTTDGTVVETDQLTDYNTGKNELTFNNLDPDTIYDLSIRGESIYNTENVYYKETTFRTAKDYYTAPSLKIFISLNTSNLISYEISTVDLSHRITDLTFKVYGIKNNGDTSKADFITEIEMGNSDKFARGAISQNNLKGYEKYYVTVNCSYQDENGNIVLMDNSNLNIEENVESAGDKIMIEFIAPSETDYFNPPTNSSILSKTGEFIIMFLLIIFGIIIFALIIKLVLNSKSKGKVKNEIEKI